MRYLVTKEVSDLPTDTAVVMVDGTVPGWAPRPGDLHFDHHKPGGFPTQLQEIGLNYRWEPNPDAVFVTTMLDADAAAAAAWIQLSGMPLDESQAYDAYVRLQAIAYDCDCLGLPSDPSWDNLRKFARDAVAALKQVSDDLAKELGLPPNRRDWSDTQRKEFLSDAFRLNTEMIIEAALGKRPWPGEQGEAKTYWENFENSKSQIFPLISEYRGCAVLNVTDLGYVDPRILVDWAREKNCGPVTLTYRVNPKLPNSVDCSGPTYAYTVGSVPLHSQGADYSALGVWAALDDLENSWRELQELPPLQTKWGGRATVGGSPHKDPCVVPPEWVIDTVLSAIAAANAA